MSRIKEKASDFVKMFGSELALEFYHDGFATIVDELFQQYNPGSLSQLIRDSEMMIISESFIRQASEHRQIIKGYTAENLTKIIFELLCEVRPDLGATMIQLSDGSASWLLKCTTMVRDRIVNIEKYREEIEKPETVKITCDSCNESFRVSRALADKLTQCPFCGSLAKEEPQSVNPEIEVEEEEE